MKKIQIENEKQRDAEMRAYKITIKNNKTGETNLEMDTDLILGVVHNLEKSSVESSAMNAIIVNNCNKMTSIAGLKVLKKLQNQFQETLLPDEMFDLLKTLFGGKNED